jgi:hypothetical protein
MNGTTQIGRLMKLKLVSILPFLALLAGAAPSAHAQQTSPIAEPSLTTPPAPPHARRRILINPRPLLYRRCVDWYELQHRPSGTVLYPQMRCWWVRG